MVIKAVNENRVEIGYKNTKQMKSDGVTKTLGEAELLVSEMRCCISQTESTGGRRIFANESYIFD
jgi:hypothetical protein